MNFAIIVAAGQSRRMGKNANKVFLPLSNKPMIYHTIKVFDNCDSIDEITIVAQKNDFEKIKVVIHPQSIVHSLVEFVDNSVIAQLGIPDMKIPIQYALTYPKRFPTMQGSLDLARIKTLEFKEPDFEMFPCMKYAYEAGVIGGTLSAVMNAANEAAVHAFLDNKIRFLDIQRLIRKMMNEHNLIKNPSLKDILEVDKKVKEETKNIIEEETIVSN